MAYPSAESNSGPNAGEHPVGTADDVAAVVSSGPDSLSLPQAPDDIPSPVCAACWAY